jgi:KamA family protein
LEKLTRAQRDELREVAAKFAFRSNNYYLSLINWDDPDDPIRRMVIPDKAELEPWGRLDPSDEQAYTVMTGLEHKYDSTALLLLSNVCDGICRYCFRKRVFTESHKECVENIPAAIEYIARHPQISNVLLTGGDPLTLPTEKLADIVSQLRKIEHVQIIRIGTKVPVFNPFRVIEDPSLLQMIDTFSTPSRKIYIMTHFSHPREFTAAAADAISMLYRAGAVIVNQCPLIRGVNDKPEILAELFRTAAAHGVPPYYLFQCRPALGNRGYTVPIEEGYSIFEQAKSLVSGLAKRAKFVMSHSSGKIEIVGRTEDRIYFKYHRAACDEDSGRFLAYRSNPDAYWLDDYAEVIKDYPIEMPYRLYGPE